MCLMLFGCKIKPKSSYQGEIISIDIDAKNVKMLNIKIKKLIKLESTDRSLFGNITSVKLYKNNIYILDKFDCQTLFLFNMQGEFVKKIYIGRGPGEMIEPWTFDIDEDNNELIIHDQMLFSFFIYDLDLNYLYKKRHDYIIEDFKKIDDDVFLIRSREWKDVKVLDQDEVNTYALVSDSFSTRKLFDITVGIKTTPTTLSNPISIYNDEVLFIAPFNNNIFQLKSGKAQVKYTIDFGKYTFSEEDFFSLTSYEMIQMIDKKERIGLFLSVINSEDYLVFDCAPYPYKTFFHSYKNGINYRLDDCIKNGLLPQCKILGLKEKSTFYAFVKPKDLKIFIQKSGMLSDTEISDSDNPSILIFEISE